MAKKIGAIVSLSIIGILIILTIVTASVKVNHRIGCEKPQIVWVNATGGDIEAKDDASKIVEYINNASKENCLSAFFGGNLDATAEVVEEAGTVTIDNTDTIYVRYHYAEKQDLTQGKEIYKDSNGKTYQYQDLLFEVQNTDGAETVKAYVIPDSNVNAGLKYSHYYNVWADFSDLYEYLNGRY